MTVNCFAEEVKERTEKRLGSDFQVEVHSIVKNNSHNVTGVSVQKNGNCFGMEVALDGVFDVYRELPEEERVNRAVETVLKAQERSVQDVEKLREWISKLHDYEEVKNLIRYKLVNAEKNQGLIATLPHIPYLDLAIVFYLEMYENPHGIASLRLNQGLLDFWEISPEELCRKALENTLKLQPYEFSNLAEKLGVPEEMRPGVHNVEKMLYVLSNKNGVNGASVILYPGVMELCADRLGGDLIVLPSSIHEVLIMRCGNDDDFQEFARTVQEINAMEVLPEEVLSDHVYRYYRAERRMEIAA